MRVEPGSMDDTHFDPDDLGPKGVLKYLGILIIIMGGALLMWQLPTPSRASRPAMLKNFIRAKDIAYVCQDYANQHGGKYPSSLEGLDPPLETSVPHWQYYDPDSERPYDWVYFGGMKAEDNAKRVILASPTASTNKDRTKLDRIVAFADAHAELWPESQYQQFLKHLATEPNQ